MRPLALGLATLALGPTAPATALTTRDARSAVARYQHRAVQRGVLHRWRFTARPAERVTAHRVRVWTSNVAWLVLDYDDPGVRDLELADRWTARLEVRERRGRLSVAWLR